MKGSVKITHYFARKFMLSDIIYGAVGAVNSVHRTSEIKNESELY